MERQEGCKGCSASVQVSPEKLERLVEIATRGRETASEEVCSTADRPVRTLPGASIWHDMPILRVPRCRKSPAAGFRLSVPFCSEMGLEGAKQA